MKFVIVLACLLAVASANEDVKALHNDAEVNIDSYRYAYELDNHNRAEQYGELKDKDNWLVHGEYEYVSKEGKHHKVTYVADEYGYQPKVEII